MVNAPLVKLFKRAGVVSGPSHLNTRHSDLSTIKDWLIGNQISFGYKAYNNFGSAVHHLWLLKRKGAWKLTLDETIRRLGMINALDGNIIATKLLAECTDRERRRGCKLNGVPIKFTPDANGKKKILDLKTTVCKSLESFIESAFKYGYFRQGLTYMKATGLKEYYIIGVCKEFPHTVYIVWLQSPEHKERMLYVEQELDFLLYFYQNYGSPRYKKVA